MLKVGIVGSGFGLYGLLPAFNSLEGCRVVSICGKQSERLVTYCQSIGLDARYTDWKEMLEQEELDAIAIAVTPNAQYEIATAAMAKGMHVFAEKPLAANTEQATTLLALAQTHNIVHTMDFIFPEIESWQTAKQLLEEEAYGPLKHISVQWDFLSYDIQHNVSSWKTMLSEGGGALAFYFSHALHYIELFAGTVLAVSGKQTFTEDTPNDGDTGVDIQLQFEHGITGDAHINANNTEVRRHIVELVCEQGVLQLVNDTKVTEDFRLFVRVGDDTKEIVISETSDAIPGEDERVRIVKKLAARFVAGISNSTSVTPSFVAGVRVHQLIDMIRKSTT